MSEPLTLVAYLRAKAGREEELGQRLRTLIEPTRRESGCLNYDLHCSHDEPGTWMLYENWRSRADLDLHFGMPYLQDFAGCLEDLLASDMELQYFRQVSEQAA